MPDAILEPWYITEIGGDPVNPRLYVVPEAQMRAAGWVPVAERDEARDVAAKWFGAGTPYNSRWCAWTENLWYAHRALIQSWAASQEARP